MTKLPIGQKQGMLCGLAMAKFRAAQIKQECERQRDKVYTADDQYTERHVATAMAEGLGILIEDIDKMSGRIAESV